MRSIFKIKFYLLFSALYIAAPAQSLNAQIIAPVYSEMEKHLVTDSLHVYKIIFIDGSEIKCRIIDFDSSSVEFQSLAGFGGSVPLSAIVKFRLIKGEWKDGNYNAYNPHDTHLLINPTAKNLKAGSVYISNSEIFLWMLSYAPADFISIGVGTTFIPTSPFTAFFGYAKAHLFSYWGFDAAVGVAAISGWNNSEILPLPFEVMTYSTKYFSVTAGIYNNFNNESLFYLGGTVKLRGRASLVIDKFIFTDNFYNSFSFAIRYNGDNFGSDFGFVILGDNDTFIIPWLGVYYNF